MKNSEIDRQKAADAAFFEDWSEWKNLDDLPSPDKRAGYHVQSPRLHNLYWCLLRRHSAAIGGPAFELRIPENHGVLTLLRDIPGIKQLPGRYYRQPGNYLVPAEHWQKLRAALPQIKRLVIQHRSKYR